MEGNLAMNSHFEGMSEEDMKDMADFYIWASDKYTGHDTESLLWHLAIKTVKIEQLEERLKEALTERDEKVKEATDYRQLVKDIAQGAYFVCDELLNWAQRLNNSYLPPSKPAQQ